MESEAPEYILASSIEKPRKPSQANVDIKQKHQIATLSHEKTNPKPSKSGCMLEMSRNAYRDNSASSAKLSSFQTHHRSIPLPPSTYSASPTPYRAARTS
jgi:hypothetical protein